MCTTTGKIFSFNFVILNCVFIIPSSPCGKKFRSKPQIARFLGDNADLTCFDFSRAGSLGDGTRRRARDRNPQATTKKLEPHHLLPQPVRPLSANPLRPSGPVRRTCGVIKLPVMLLSPPVGDVELRDSILGEQGIAEQKLHTLNVVVQSLWERRLKGVSPHDHASGKEVSRTEPQIPPIAPPSYPTPRPDHTSPLLMSTTLSQTTSVLPSLLGSTTLRSTASQQTSINSNKFTTAKPTTTPLTGTRLLQIHQQQQSKVSPTPSLHSHSSIPLTVTDSDVRLQEQRVLLLRQQLMAAQSSL